MSTCEARLFIPKGRFIAYVSGMTVDEIFCPPLIIIIIIIIIFIRTPPNRYRTRQTYTRTKYVQQNMYNKIAKHNTRCFNNITHNKSRSNQSNYIYFNLMYQSCPSENPRNCSRLSLEEIF
jgi:hypothetical protein